MADSFKDARDGQTYHTVEINGTVWMAENLNFAADNAIWYYNYEANGKLFGRLYTWWAAQAACPRGWRLPTKEDIDQLLAYYGSEKNAYDQLIIGGSSGFNGLLSGFYDDLIPDKFRGIGTDGIYWTATERGDDFANSYQLRAQYQRLHLSTQDLKSRLFSVRCIQEE